MCNYVEAVNKKGNLAIGTRATVGQGDAEDEQVCREWGLETAIIYRCVGAGRFRQEVSPYIVDRKIHHKNKFTAMLACSLGGT